MTFRLFVAIVVLLVVISDAFKGRTTTNRAKQLKLNAQTEVHIFCIQHNYVSNFMKVMLEPNIHDIPGLLRLTSFRFRI